jgi:hypothetical protein
MKKLTGLMILMLLSALIVSGVYVQTQQNVPASKPKLEVLYFHATMRCPTCLAIEDNARKVIQQNFKPLLDNGMIKFEAYNVDEKANKPLVDKYEITFSTLLLVKSDGTKVDFTGKAFQYALANPAKYESLLNAEIEKLVNQ